MREHKKSHLGMIGWGMFLAGALSLGSCSGDETLETMEKKAIAFGSVSIENGSRAADPSYSTVSLNSFNVWGTVTGNTENIVLIFDGDEVERPSTLTEGTYNPSTAWDCDETQYWIPAATYNFMAIANANSVTPDDNGMPKAIGFEMSDGSKDLILAEPVAVRTNDYAEPISGVNTSKYVPFTFTHLLSKVHFTFEDSNGNPVTNTEISNIQVTGHYGSGTYTIGAATPWGNQVPAPTTSPLSFGGIDANDTEATTSQYARLIIPGTQTWSIKFAQNGETIDEPLILEGETAGTGYTFAPNTQYNILVTVGSNITFTINSLEAWGAEQNIPLNP